MLNISSKYTFYFTYIANLNYWETNLVYLLVIFSFFFFSSAPFLLFFVLFIHTSLFFQIGFVKTLIPNLLVGTVSVHPIAFYFFTCIFLFKGFNKDSIVILLLLKLRLTTLYFFLTITLMLGGFWATQSVSWGYFWVNDSIEWLLFVIIIVLFIKFHFWNFNSSTINVFVYSVVILNLLIFVRLNFFPTRHNFIASSSTLLVTLLFYFIVFFFIYKNLYRVNKTSCTLYGLILFYFYFIFYLFFYKYIFIFLFFLIFEKKLYSGVYRFKLHILILLFGFMWIIFFRFFFLNYQRYTFIFFFEFYIFNNMFSSQYQLLFNGLSLLALELVNFFLTYICVSYSFFKGIVFSNILNNVSFIVLILFLLYLKLFELRLLYKKKTLI